MDKKTSLIILGFMGVAMAWTVVCYFYGNTARPGRCYSHFDRWETIMAKVTAVSQYQDERTSYPLVRYEFVDNGKDPQIAETEHGDGNFYGLFPKVIDCSAYEKTRAEVIRRRDKMEVDKDLSALKTQVKALNKAVFHLIIQEATCPPHCDHQ